MTPEKRDWVVLRQTILAEAFRSFLHLGYAKTRITDIAKTIGVQPATIRQVFPAKRELVRALFDDERVSVRRQLEIVFQDAAAGDPAAVAETLKRVFYIMLNSVFLRMVYHFDDFPILYCVERSGAIEGDTSLMERYIAACQQTGTIRGDDAVAAAHAFRTILSMLIGEPSISRESGQSLEFLIDILINGLVRS